MNTKLKKPELLAPARDWPTLITAIEAGADAVYFGVGKLNMRMKAGNFKVEELPEIVNYCRERNVDAHLTLNTIVYENEAEDVETIVRAAKEAGITLVICWDPSVIMACKSSGVNFCISTQASVSNPESAKFYKMMGASRIVPARECSLPQIRSIREKAGIEVEAFIHGAMCVAVSGRCFMSLDAFGKSANRGECYQPCRREYKIVDETKEIEFVLGEDYVMSPKDLSTIGFIDLLIEAGIDSFKIEGRKRSPEYVKKVVGAYRRAIDAYFEGGLTSELKIELENDLAEVYNRGLSDGFYFGVPGDESFARSYGSKATTTKIYAGKVLNYFDKAKAVFVKLEAEPLQKGDKIYIIGPTTGTVELNIQEMVVDEQEVDAAEKSSEVTFVCAQKVRRNDKVYKVVSA
ncbi:MAG: U32 family peptidase [Ignavibacteriales bacterium]|nr:U32 family peptidase [Ignavibacteriales bacterium]MCF8316746.1 U32 family peptidase [Ignavibacteriales bacterium]MCF8436020.1 U32 family peptidase [Ignavibacteriales bacterium]